MKRAQKSRFFCFFNGVKVFFGFRAVYYRILDMKGTRRFGSVIPNVRMSLYFPYLGFGPVRKGGFPGWIGSIQVSRWFGFNCFEKLAAKRKQKTSAVHLYIYNTYIYYIYDKNNIYNIMYICNI